MIRIHCTATLLILIAWGVGCQTTGMAERGEDSVARSALTASPQAAEAPGGRTELPPARPVAVDESGQQDADIPEIGKTFKSHGLAIEYYESQGFVTMGQFAHSKWPASVVYVKEAINEIGVTLKKGGPHRWPGNDGYRMKAVFLEDADGEETVLVLRSAEKVKPVPLRPAGELK